MKHLLLILICASFSFGQQYLRPTDIHSTTGHWYYQGATSLWETIDEVTPSDIDYNVIIDNDFYFGAQFSVWVDVPAQTPASGTRTCRFRARAANLNSGESSLLLSVTVRRLAIKLGGLDVNLTEAWQDFSFTFDEPGGWGGIFIKFSTDLFITDELLYVSWAELEVPNASGATSPKRVMIMAE